MWDKVCLERIICDSSLTLCYFSGDQFSSEGGGTQKSAIPGFNSQIRVGRDSNGIHCLIFEEDVKTKTNQGS